MAGEESGQGGLKCPYCHCRYVRVTNTYERVVWWNGQKIEHVRRRRQCQHCGLGFHTRETIEPEGETDKAPLSASKAFEGAMLAPAPIKEPGNPKPKPPRLLPDDIPPNPFV